MKKKIKLKDIEGLGAKDLEERLIHWRQVLVALLIWLTILSMVFFFKL